jgi:hypothetical protein
MHMARLLDPRHESTLIIREYDWVNENNTAGTKRRLAPPHYLQGPCTAESPSWELQLRVGGQ